jgi:hypothetical protein
MVSLNSWGEEIISLPILLWEPRTEGLFVLSKMVSGYVCAFCVAGAVGVPLENVFNVGVPANARVAR